MENNTGYIKKSIEVNASDDRVFQTLTTNERVKKWASAFHEGTWVDTDWAEGSVITWNRVDGGVGAKGIIEVNYAPRVLKVRYFDDVDSEEGADLGEYTEHFTLLEQEGKTMLTIEAGPLPADDLASHEPMWEKAIGNIKAETEQGPL